MKTVKRTPQFFNGRHYEKIAILFCKGAFCDKKLKCPNAGKVGLVHVVAIRMWYVCVVGIIFCVLTIL